MFEVSSTRQFVVVCNEEGQYSTWPAEYAVPEGWQAQDFSGSQAECLEYIGRVWTDMRPRSLREVSG
nr:MbtH family NRPS accessory protein [Streptomyces virginiae]